MSNVLPGSSAIGVCSSGNILPTELMSQGSLVQQNRVLLGSPPGPTATPSPIYQNVSSFERGGRTTQDQISTSNWDDLTAESHPELANWLNLRAQRTPSIIDNSVFLPSSPNCLAFEINSPCPRLAQTEQLPNTSAQHLRDSDLRLGILVDTYARSSSAFNGDPPSFLQQQCRDIRGRCHFQEEKHGQIEKDQAEMTAPSSAAALWSRALVSGHERGSSDEKEPEFDKFSVFRFQQKCIKLYGSWFPIHNAIQMNDCNRVRQLLKKNNPNSYDRETGETPMHLACRLGKLKLVKLLRRHPKINMNLRTISAEKAVSHPGSSAVQIAHYFGKLEVLNFLVHFKPKDHKRYAKLTPQVHELNNEQEIIKQELDRLKADIKAYSRENEELEKKLRGLELEDVCVMGKKLPRNKPTDYKKLAGVLKIVRELEGDLTALQERIWSEREDEKMCIICTERQGDTVLVPCGHFFCSVCSRTVDQCPNCRKQIERRIKTFR